jgi:7-cyano-7-deazaguanine synthase
MDSCVTESTARETWAFDEIADFYPVHRRPVVELDHFAQTGDSALTDDRISVPEAHTGSAVGGNEIPPTYVPFRNAHFLRAAVSWAEVIGANAEFVGAVAEDTTGDPDCRPEYYQVRQQFVREGAHPETHIEIVTPVIGMRKWEIVKRGMELGAPLDRTWSCHQFEEAACGECDSCLSRLRAFAEAGIGDPIAYQVQVERQ